MFKPFSLFIGLRYTRAKKRNHFVSFISLASMLGIALGVAVLITVLSVMNGFDEQIKERIFGMAPHITIQDVSGSLQNWKTIEKESIHYPEVLAVAPFISGEGMLANSGTVTAALFTGIDPAQEKNISVVAKNMVQGSLDSLVPGKYRIVIGKKLADSLGLTLGSKVTAVIPKATVSIVGIMPRFKPFTVSGIFSAGNGFGFDSALAFINLKDAQTLYQLGEGITGIRLKIDNLYAAPKISQIITQKLTPNYFVTNWTETYGPLFSAIKLEKNMMFLILLLLVAIAVFNLVVSLVMVVNDKRTDIAILRTFGATPRSIMSIFIVQGSVIGVIGTILGIIGGITLALNATVIVNGIQNTFHIQFFSSSVYYVDYLPSKLEWFDVSRIAVAALIMSLLATIYPARRAAKTQPAEALRYE